MKRTRQQRRGLALVMVLVVIGCVSVTGFAMLSEASLQSQSAANASQGAQALSFAHSGVQLASYYLLNPQKAPSLNVQGYWPGGTSLALGDAAGTADVTVVDEGSNVYTITSVGRVTDPSGTGVAKTVITEIKANPGLKWKYGAAFSGNTTTLASVTIVSDAMCNGIFTSLGTVLGKVYCLSALHLSLTGPLDATTMMTITDVAHIKDYSTYKYQGKTYNAVTITAASLSGAQNFVTATNPAGIVYHNGPLTLSSNVAFTGTLINLSGAVTVAGSNNSINPVDGFPALINKGDMVMSGAGRDLNVNGAAWLGGKVKSSGLALTSKLNLNGSTMFAGPTAFDTLLLAQVKIGFDPATTNVPDMDTSIPPPSVQVNYETTDGVQAAPKAKKKGGKGKG